MKCLFVFSLLIISAIFASPINTEDRALQIAKEIEDEVAKNIIEGNTDGIASRFSDNFRYKECDGKTLNRAEMVEKMMERKTKTSIPTPIYIDQDMLSDSEMYYILDERFASGDVLSSNILVEKIGGTWKLTYAEERKCK